MINININRQLLDDVATSVKSFCEHGTEGGILTLKRDYKCALRLFEAIPSDDAFEDFMNATTLDVSGWLLGFPFELARAGMVVEAAHLQRVWSDIFERANFLGDRAVILAEAGRRDETFEQITELEKEFPDDVWVQIKIGDALKALKEPGPAEERYRRALAMTTDTYDREGARERLIPLLREQGRADEAQALEMHTPDVQELCQALRSRWYVTEEEIDAILANREFFQPYLRNALAKRGRIARVPETPIDATDCQAIFLLTELGDTEIIPDLINCLKMSAEDLRLLYGDSLTEHLWLPFARLGHNHLENIWKFVTDATADLYARGAAVAGVLATHHFHPERRAEAVAFLQRLVSRTDVFPIDHLAGILCDCADSGLTELTEQAKEFAARMDDDEGIPYPMATADDVREAFRDGTRAGFISGRPHDVYAVNRRWQIWAERQEQRKSRDADEPGVASSAMPVVSRAKKVGRNDPCPCGSGKKFKKCHGM